MKTVISLIFLLFSYSAVSAPLSIGDNAPDFEATTLNGAPVSLLSLTKQRPVYLKFWATWCQYCLAEMPYLAALEKKYGDKLSVISINVGINDSIENINAYFKRNNLALPTVFDSKGNITQQYGVLGTPYHVLIDTQSLVAYTSFLHSEDIEKTIDTLIAKGE